MYTLKNSTQLIGTVSNEPSIIITAKGTKQAAFMIATVERYKNQAGEKISEVQLHYIVAWGKIADLVEKYVSKGTSVAVEGKLCSRIYMNKYNVKVRRTEIQLRELMFLDHAESKAKTA